MSPIDPPILSPREAEIVELAIEGLTNDGIAHTLGISIGTVNTYWLRIRLKVGGIGRTDTVAKVISERAERALRSANVDREAVSAHVADRERQLLEMHASHALLLLAIEQIRSTVWVADKQLTLAIVANGDMPTTHFGVVWEVGKTINEIFKSDDPTYPPVAAHLDALKGKESNFRLEGEFEKMILKTLPVEDDNDEIIGCIGILNYVSNGDSH